MTALEELLGLLDLDQISDDLYRARTPTRTERSVYGGQITSQALAAAGRTVPIDHRPHSLHAYFHQRANPVKAIHYQISRVSDGRTFTNRHVSAIQDDKIILTLLTSFHRAEQGVVHQDPMPAAVEPENLLTYPERLAKAFNQPVMPLWQPFDMRFAGPLSFEAAKDHSLRTKNNIVWIRADGTLPPDRHDGSEILTDPAETPRSSSLLHACLLTYISDITLLDTLMIFHGLSWNHDVIRGVSLDHAMWFHRPFRADEWLLYAQETPVAYGARGMVRGQVFSRDGRMVASVAQEGLIRVASHDRSSTE